MTVTFRTAVDQAPEPLAHERPMRVFVFTDRTDALLVCAPDGASVALPEMRPPFTRQSVVATLRDAGITCRVTEGPAGRWTPSILMAKSAAKAEAKQRENLAKASSATILLSSNEPLEQHRADIILRRQAVDETIGRLKAELAEAKRVAYERAVYMERQTWVRKTKRLEDLKAESQALMAALSEVNRKLKDRNVRCQSSPNHAFVRAAFRLLDEETLRRIEIETDAASDAEGTE